jgi:hypothetical protein
MLNEINWDSFNVSIFRSEFLPEPFFISINVSKNLLIPSENRSNKILPRPFYAFKITINEIYYFTHRYKSSQDFAFGTMTFGHAKIIE